MTRTTQQLTRNDHTARTLWYSTRLLCRLNDAATAPLCTNPAHLLRQCPALPPAARPVHAAPGSQQHAYSSPLPPGHVTRLPQSGRPPRTASASSAASLSGHRTQASHSSHPPGPHLSRAWAAEERGSSSARAVPHPRRRRRIIGRAGGRTPVWAGGGRMVMVDLAAARRLDRLSLARHLRAEEKEKER